MPPRYKKLCSTSIMRMPSEAYSFSVVKNEKNWALPECLVVEIYVAYEESAGSKMRDISSELFHPVVCSFISVFFAGSVLTYWDSKRSSVISEQ